MCSPNTQIGKWEKQGAQMAAGQAGVDLLPAETQAEIDARMALVEKNGVVWEAARIGNPGMDPALAALDAKVAEDNKPKATPPIAPDLTDKAVQAARLRAARQLALGQNLRSTFLTGPQGVTAPKPLGYQSLYGGGK
jgi:hypothetical protein